MTGKRMALTVLAAFVVSQIVAAGIHGFILAADYGPYYGTLLRSTSGAPPAQMLLLPVAHVCFICALVWTYARLRLAGSRLARGLKLGVLGWLIGEVPLWLLWYAEQPWPGTLVVKQLVLELAGSLLIGITIALVAGARTADRLPAHGEPA
jgi:hypothetical protein